MPKQNMTSLNNFRHRVVLATSYTESDGVNDGESANIVLTRKEVKNIIASITPTKGTFFLNGFALQENRNAASHYICIRFNRDIDITGFAWVYEDRPSGRRWYKILSVEEMAEKQRFWMLQSRLQQKSDLATQPATEKPSSDFLALPNGVEL